MHLVHLGALLEMEGKVGPGCLVVGAEQGNALAAVRPLEVSPVSRIPGESKAQGAVEGLGTLHVLDAQSHMAQAMEWRGGHQPTCCVAPFWDDSP
jgi:hypothetical protein